MLLRRTRLLAIVAAAAFLLASCSRPHRPSIVLIVIDTLRADELEAHGSTPPTTPSLAALAKAGVSFDDLVAASSVTTTSVACILTGKYPDELGVRGLRYPLPQSAHTLAERLKEGGYTTAAVLSNPLAGPLYGFDQGFDTLRFENYVGDSPEQQARRRPVFTADRVTDRALEVRSKLRSPFFLYVHYTDPHDPYLPPPGWLDRYLGGRAPLEEAQLSPPGLLALTPEESLTARAYYRAKVAFADREIGRFLSALPPDTLVIVTADHGEEFRDHGGMVHGHTLFQELVHAPLIVRGAGLPAGKRVHAPVTHADITPTVLDYAGVPADSSLDGTSLRGAIEGSSGGDRPRMLFSVLESENGTYSTVRRGSLKLHRRPDGRVILVDLASDPLERTDLSVDRAIDAAILEAALDARHARLVSAPAPESLEGDRERLEQLRALGYLR